MRRVRRARANGAAQAAKRFPTFDVNVAGAIHDDPDRMSATINPFWALVIGPVHAGAFGAGYLDVSFGPEYASLQTGVSPNGRLGLPVRFLQIGRPRLAGADLSGSTLAGADLDQVDPSLGRVRTTEARRMAGLRWRD